ncbi:uncharacterized protein BX663DRAFT_550500 [Cokeromyces recurvatus]|uniref:uncharacterized protein n=1 Tax=Cokeromyces recurvatus TaxID=90255 RepID=UPI002221044C|nr:uncharacterized protein BX663DRAFT_550500 [Cokeromyces recurvatus]KAI7904876.1 hypothetical protein BX663DRAFT_550500 [Cokeromyces recurvatus]
MELDCCENKGSSSKIKMDVYNKDMITNSKDSFINPQQQQQSNNELIITANSKNMNMVNKRRPQQSNVITERRSVNRRSSLMPRSKALLRVIDQTDEDSHLGDIEMRREYETTTQLKNMDNSIETLQQGVPPASWTKMVDMPLYQCSKLNPEIEMTNFQLENTIYNKTIKRKASAEDRLFDPYPIPISLKRRAVSPSLSLNGSPILSDFSSPPIPSTSSSYSFFNSYFGGTASANAAARAQQKPSSNSTFNLHEASGGLSRMSLE